LDESKIQRLVDLGLFDEKQQEICATIETTSHAKMVQTKWEEMFRLLQDYKMEFGTCRVFRPHGRSGKYKGLEDWTRYWRKHIQLYRTDPSRATDTLDVSKLQRLVDLGLFEGRQAEDVSMTSKETKNAEADGTKPAETAAANDGNDRASMMDEDKSEEQDETTSERKSAHAVLLVAKWEEKFRLLEDYQMHYGTCYVNRRHTFSGKYKGLRRWTIYWRKQIELYREDPLTASGTLDESKVQRLLELRLLERRDEEEDADIPAAETDDAHPDPSSRTPERTRASGSENNAYKQDNQETPTNSYFIIQKAQWEEKFELLQAYKDEYRTCYVSKDHVSEKYKALVRWSEYWRHQVKLFQVDPNEATRNLDEVRFTRLVEIGLIAQESEPSIPSASEGEEENNKVNNSDAKEDEDEAAVSKPDPTCGLSRRQRSIWEEHFQMLKAYKKEHGTCDVNREHCLDGKSQGLHRWVTQTREELQKSSHNMGELRVHRLQSIGVTKSKKSSCKNSKGLVAQPGQAVPRNAGHVQDHSQLNPADAVGSTMPNWSQQAWTQPHMDNAHSRLTQTLAMLAIIPLTSKNSRLLRTGQWFPEEIEYANSLIQAFDGGQLPISDGISLTVFLAFILHCEEVRVIQRLPGDMTVGHRCYKRRIGVSDAEIRSMLASLNE
jgi:hypothetical protein